MLFRLVAALGLAAALLAAEPVTSHAQDFETTERHEFLNAGAPRGRSYDFFSGWQNAIPKTTVSYSGPERPGTIIINTAERRLYYVLDEARALRYGIGVGRSQGANFRGTGVVGRKEKWPYWTPTGNMMAAIPEYRKYSAGLPGGEENPLGPRALYLYRDGKDTMFRLHGTNQPQSIGHAMSSGCIRMLNHDIIDLYSRVPVGSKVVVLQA